MTVGTEARVSGKAERKALLSIAGTAATAIGGCAALATATSGVADAARASPYIASAVRVAEALTALA